MDNQQNNASLLSGAIGPGLNEHTQAGNPFNPRNQARHLASFTNIPSGQNQGQATTVSLPTLIHSPSTSETSSSSTGASKKSTLQLWSVLERDFLMSNLVKHAKKTGKEPIGSEWEEIAAAQNDKFEGRILRLGAPLVMSNLFNESDVMMKKRSVHSLRFFYLNRQDLRNKIYRVVNGDQALEKRLLDAGETDDGWLSDQKENN